LNNILSTLKWGTIFFLAIFFIGSIANSLIMIGMGPDYGTRTEYEAHMHFIYRALVCLVITVIVVVIKIVINVFLNKGKTDTIGN